MESKQSVLSCGEVRRRGRIQWTNIKLLNLVENIIGSYCLLLLSTKNNLRTFSSSVLLAVWTLFNWTFLTSLFNTLTQKSSCNSLINGEYFILNYIMRTVLITCYFKTCLTQNRLLQRFFTSSHENRLTTTRVKFSENKDIFATACYFFSNLIVV